MKRYGTQIQLVNKVVDEHFYSESRGPCSLPPRYVADYVLEHVTFPSVSGAWLYAWKDLNGIKIINGRHQQQKRYDGVTLILLACVAEVIMAPQVYRRNPHPSWEEQIKNYATYESTSEYELAKMQKLKETEEEYDEFWKNPEKNGEIAYPGSLWCKWIFPIKEVERYKIHLLN